uniref:DNA2/NAM7 helicase-like C-terminal domain-containing protein n=1 Tax=Phaeocystis antarctica TaxID=33657 RepID=A0A7S0NG26_9EUKA
MREMLRERGLAAVNVGTVDDYQGQEKRVLFISTVLTHNIKQHHLVFNPKRFNVAVTRAKALLVVVGNPLAMLDDPSWRALLTHAVELSAYRGCPHPLMMEGAEEDLDDTVTRMTEITQLASRALGAGNLSAMYPSLSGNQDSQYSEYDDLPWRVML